MDNEELLLELSKAIMNNDNGFKVEVFDTLFSSLGRIDSEAEETLNHMIRSNGIQFTRPNTVNNNLEKIRELNVYIAERVGLCYIFDLNQADSRIFDAISKLCSQTTKDEFQNVQLYAKMRFNAKLIDIFDLKEKLSAKFDKV